MCRAQQISDMLITRSLSISHAVLKKDVREASAKFDVTSSHGCSFSPVLRATPEPAETEMLHLALHDSSDRHDIQTLEVARGHAAV